MMSIFSARKVTAGVFVLMLASSASLGKAYFEVDDTTYRLGNGFLERVFAKKGDSLSTIWLKNKVTGHTWPVRSDEFQVRFTYERLSYWTNLENPVIIDSRDCSFLSHQAEPTEGGPGMCGFECASFLVPRRSSFASGKG